MTTTSKKLKNSRYSTQKIKGKKNDERDEVLTLKKLREDAKLTREQVAIILGIKKDTVRKYETSARVPNKKNLSKFQRALGCTKQDMSKAIAFHTLERMEKDRAGLDHLLKAQ